MQLIMIGYFDLGISFDINDQPFLSEQKRQKLQARIKYHVKYPACELPIGINLPLGKGLRIEFDESFAQEWLMHAREKPHSKDLQDLFDNLSLKDLQDLFDNISLKECYIDVYSIGIAIIILHIYNLLPGLYSSYINFYKCFEYAGYENISKQLKSICRDIIAIFARNSLIEQISKRFDIEDVGDSDFIPGFTCIFLCDNDCEKDNVIKIAQDYERQYRFKRLNLDDGTLYLGWACSVLIPRTDKYERIIHLIKIAHLFYGIAEAFEKLFYSKMIDSTRDILGEEDHIGEKDNIYDSVRLNALKTFSSTIVELTFILSVSNNISDWHFLKAFNDISQLDVRRRRIHAISNIFDKIRSEKNRIEWSKKEKILRNIAYVLTILTIESVIGDIINTVDYAYVIFPSPLVRFVVLIIPIMLLLTIWILVFKTR